MTDQQFDIASLPPEVRARLVAEAELKVAEVNSSQARAIEQAREEAASAEIIRQVQAIGGRPTNYQRQHIIEAAHKKYQVWGYAKKQGG